MYKVTSVEDQQKFVVPLNSLSEKLFYNQRMIIDTKVDVNSGAQPRAWHITKVNRISPSALARITLAQDHFDEHADYIEYLEEDNPSTIIGMWADYNKSGVTPEEYGDPIVPTRIINIEYNDIEPEIKIQGSSVLFAVKFIDGTDETLKTELPFEPGDWSFTINDQDATDLLEITYPDDSDELKENQITIRFIGPNKYIGKILCVKFRTDKDKGADYIVSGYVEMSIVGL